MTWIGDTFGGLLIALSGVLKVSNAQSVSHSSVLFGTLLSSTPVS
jgi:hypothetical protein